MLFSSLFKDPIIKDDRFRMVFPMKEANAYMLFNNYTTASEFSKIIKASGEHMIVTGHEPFIEQNLLDFETEGKWVCLSRIGGKFKLKFELQSDYAMFRLFGFDE